PHWRGLPSPSPFGAALPQPPVPSKSTQAIDDPSLWGPSTVRSLRPANRSPCVDQIQMPGDSGTASVPLEPFRFWRRQCCWIFESLQKTSSTPTCHGHEWSYSRSPFGRSHRKPRNRVPSLSLQAPRPQASLSWSTRVRTYLSEHDCATDRA